MENRRRNPASSIAADIEKPEHLRWSIVANPTLPDVYGEAVQVELELRDAAIGAVPPRPLRTEIRRIEDDVLGETLGRVVRPPTPGAEFDVAESYLSVLILVDGVINYCEDRV
jgi:hypothetical protein